MKSTKKSVKSLLIGGVIGTIIGLFLTIYGFASYGVNSTRSTTVIDKTVISTDIDWLSIFLIIIGIIMLIISLTSIVLYASWRKDYIEINDQCISGIALSKYFSYKWEDVIDGKATNTSLIINVKNLAQPVKVFYINNPEVFAKAINDKKIV